LDQLMLTLLAVWLALSLGPLVGAPAALADARSDCFQKSGDVAIRACTEAIGRNSADVVSYINRAFEHLQKGNTTNAIADYSKAIELDPGRADAYAGRAWAFLKGGKAAQALPDAERSLQLKTNDARALDIRGHVYEALGRHEEAIADFRSALAIEPRLQGSKEGLRRLGAGG
jgi:tetratricopeptide (TPR) repeat protein